jgi:hypothetical protein
MRCISINGRIYCNCFNTHFWAVFIAELLFLPYWQLIFFSSLFGNLTNNRIYSIPCNAAIDLITPRGERKLFSSFMPKDHLIQGVNWFCKPAPTKSSKFSRNQLKFFEKYRFFEQEKRF